MLQLLYLLLKPKGSGSASRDAPLAGSHGRALGPRSVPNAPAVRMRDRAEAAPDRCPVDNMPPATAAAADLFMVGIKVVAVYVAFRTNPAGVRFSRA